MLQASSPPVAEYYERAANVRMKADGTRNPKIRKDLVDLEERWLKLARSSEFAERLLSFSIYFNRIPRKL